MQDISSNPSLAKPTDPKGGLGSGPLILPTTPPTGKAVPLQAEVEQWMCDGSLDKLHAVYHKVSLPATSLMLSCYMHIDVCKAKPCMQFLASVNPYHTIIIPSYTTSCSDKSLR